ncbi:DUF3237 domain-containing protein [Arthrobacter sp. NA-172]|uniref:DUF3237 domain-containing protein n=1 Tax=Arthrobacter sp. NA-172 TaxID=3367524 RepID=UPI00375454E7
MTPDRNAAPALTFFAELSVAVGAPIDVGPTPEGHRRIVPIIGGTFNGPQINGKVLSGGADHQILRSRELTELDARYALETDAGQRIYVHNTALRHGTAEDIECLNRGEEVAPERIYFRCWPRLTTSAPELAWLNNQLAVGTGERHPGRVVVRVFLID